MIDVDVTGYEGKWVALAWDGGTIWGAGETAELALEAGRAAAPRARLRPWFVEPKGGKALVLAEELAALRPLLVQQTRPIFLVGGAVRDALLGRVSHDLDFVVPKEAIKIAYRLGDQLGKPTYIMDKERDVARIMAGEGIDLARYRGEGGLEGDLRARDFTVNAMALPVMATTRAGVIDPCGGMGDLEAKVIRLAYGEAFVDDPVRMIRAARQAIQLGFEVAEETVVAIKEALGLFDKPSPERIRDELLKLIKGNGAPLGLEWLQKWGVLAAVWPELEALAGVEQSEPHHEDVWRHTVAVMRWVLVVEAAVGGEGDADLVDAVGDWGEQIEAHWERPVDGGLNGHILFRLGALFHDVGKKATQTVEADTGRIRFFKHDQVGAEVAEGVMRHYRMSRAGQAGVAAIVAGHMRPLLLSGEERVTRRAAFRFFKQTGEAGLDICLLSVADYLATYGGRGEVENWERLLGTVRTLLRFYFEEQETVVNPPPLLDGRQVMKLLKMAPGPQVGEVLLGLQEAQAVGEVMTVEEATAWVLAWGSD
ncbi:MAG TPA: HDIG domain-containing protein [Anaerolineae bacterium]|nr:HDIG domain-containing protein [Anaerolineae bacterium]